MSVCLIMLTNTYPFDGGEYFIENEIGILSRSFDRVIICALDANADDALTRDVPENTDAFITGNRSRKRERAGDLVKAAVRMALGGTKEPDIMDEACTDATKRLFREYFLSRTQRQLKQVMGKLKIEELKKYDRVIIYSYWLFVGANVASELKKELINRGVNAEKAVSRAHRYDIYEERNALNYLPQREYLLRNLDRIFPCSDHGERYLKEKYPAFAEKIERSFLGTADRGAKPQRENEMFTVVTCSSLSPVKRIWRVADALSLYRGERKIKWIHIGGSGKKLEKLKEYSAEKLMGSDAVCEFKGRMENERVLSFYLESSPDLFLNVSESEGLPVSIMEASSVGIPVIATDCGGTGEEVEDEVTGKLIKKDFSDAELLGEIIKFMSLEKSVADKMSAASRDMWRKKFSAEKNYSDFSKHLLS